MLTSLSPCPALPMGPVGYTAGCQAPKPGLPGLVQLSMGWDLRGVSRRGQKSRTCYGLCPPGPSRNRLRPGPGWAGVGGGWGSGMSPAAGKWGWGGTHHLPHADAGRLHHGPVGDGASRLLLDVRVPGEQLLHHLPAGQTHGERGPPSGPRGGEAPGALAGRGAYFTFRYSSRVMRPSLSESYM